MLEATPTYFGKLPAHSDFVAHNAEGETFRAFDRWLQVGLHVGKFHQRLGELPDSTRRGQKKLAFLFSPMQGNESLAGYLWESKDAVGREFPFWAGYRIQHPASGVSHAQVIQMLQAAAPALPDQIGRTDCRHVLKVLSERSRFSVQQSYLVFLQRATVGSLMGQLFHSGGLRRGRQMLYHLLECIKPITSVRIQEINLGLRLPLGEELMPEGNQMIWMFWIDLIKALTGSEHRFFPTLFWTSLDGASSPHLTLFFRPPTPADFSSIMDTQQESDSISDLRMSGDYFAARAEASSHPLMQLASRADLTLSSFLDQVTALPYIQLNHGRA